jgi:6-phosphogluconolactonase (cycloisomerase 2 family)
MWARIQFLCVRGSVALISLFVASGFATATGGPHYLVTNDDVPAFFPTSVTFYTVGTGGSLTLKQQVMTGGSGINGGYFGANRVIVLDNANAQCVYSSEATTSDIVGINVSTLQVGGSALGSSGDTGLSNGIGLAINSQYLYASFSDSNTIGTFQLQPGCTLTFVNDVSVGGLQGGIIDAMAIHGNMLIATYGDGSIESFDISNGTPVSNGDKQNSTSYSKSQGSSYPTGIDITKDGHFALFGDTSTSDIVEVSDISSGKLTKTVVYYLGQAIGSSNIMLSPDETLLYISNTQGDVLSAAFFDTKTGKLTTGCASGNLKSYVSSWSYLASMALGSATGTGGFVYIAEFGSPSSVAIIQVTSSGGKCTLTEMSKSPVSDIFSTGLLSIGTFPPRSF